MTNTELARRRRQLSQKIREIVAERRYAATHPDADPRDHEVSVMIAPTGPTQSHDRSES